MSEEKEIEVCEPVEKQKKKIHPPLEQEIVDGEPVFKDNGSVYDTNHSVKPAEWTVENELILVEWCDIGQCYKWLNNRSYLKFASMHAWFTIPAIVMSTITGTASFAQSSFSDGLQLYVRVFNGTINILVSVLRVVEQYLKIGQMSESHRISSISWDKFARNIRIELAKIPTERMEAGHFLKLCRHEYDRLMETSPPISNEIIEEFKRRFEGKEGTLQNSIYMELRKPDICDTIVSANHYRHKWYLDPPSSSDDDDDDANNSRISSKTLQAIEKNQQSAEQNKKIVQKNLLQVAKKIKDQKDKIDNYLHMFKITYGREPLEHELYEHFKGEIEEPTLRLYFEHMAQNAVINEAFSQV